MYYNIDSYTITDSIYQALDRSLFKDYNMNTSIFIST